MNLKICYLKIDDTSEVLRLPRKMTIEVSKVLQLPWKCNSSSENDAKVLRLPHKTTFDTLSNRLKCYKVPPLPRETKPREVWNLQKVTPFAELAKRPRANGCEQCGRLVSVKRTHPQPPDPQSETGTLATQSGKRSSLLKWFKYGIIEKSSLTCEHMIENSPYYSIKQW